VEKSKEYIEKAQLVLALFDSSRPLDEEDEEILSLLSGQPSIILLTKQDLPARLTSQELQQRLPEVPIIPISTPLTPHQHPHHYPLSFPIAPHQHPHPGSALGSLGCSEQP
jgi:GTPase Era involved in 16S rRNA processing